MTNRKRNSKNCFTKTTKIKNYTFNYKKALEKTKKLIINNNTCKSSLFKL